MSAASRRIAAVSAIVAALLLGPALPAIGVAIGGSSMVARVGAEAERARSATVVGTTAPPSTAASSVAEVIRLTNIERAAAGRPPLVPHPAVAAAAAAHSGDQAVMQRMSHTGSDGSNAGDRLTRAGYRWRTWGENVATGEWTASGVVSAWMSSPSHRANILDGSFTTIGVGVATGVDGRVYWTMVLAA